MSDADSTVFRIPLKDGKGFALVDEGDFELLSRFRWRLFVSRRGVHYARLSPRPWTFMHRMILGLTDRNVLADHKNGDGLDNRRDNLRQATQSQNQANRVNLKAGRKWRGVHVQHGCIVATIMVRRKSMFLGCFSTEEEAARAYDSAAIQHFGEFARLNFPVL